MQGHWRSVPRPCPVLQLCDNAITQDHHHNQALIPFQNLPFQFNINQQTVEWSDWTQTVVAVPEVLSKSRVAETGKELNMQAYTSLPSHR